MDAQAIKHFTPASAAEPSKIAVVYVTFYSETLGGQTVQSNQFQFPVMLLRLPLHGAKDRRS